MRGSSYGNTRRVGSGGADGDDKEVSVMDEKEQATEQEYERKAVAEGDMALVDDVPEPEEATRQASQGQARRETEPGDDQGAPA